jgi:tetratricopeptide (TPR) repeat protein
VYLRNSYQNRALAYGRLDRHAEAARDWAWVTQLCTPGERAWANFQYGAALFRAGAWTDAEVVLDRGLVLREQAAQAAGPDGRDPAWQLALYLIDRGLLYSDANQNEKAVEWMGRSARAFESFRQKWPGPDPTYQLRWSYQHRAIALQGLRKYADAVKDWDQVVLLCPPADRPGVRAARAAARAVAGQAVEAAAEVAELVKLSDWPAVQWYDFACVYALASAKLPDREKEYADKAMELLGQAVKAGYKDAAHLRADADLGALRGRDDFKALVAELEKKFPPKLERAPPPREK